MLALLTTLLAIATFELRSDSRWTNASTNTRFTFDSPEQPTSRLFENLELRILFANSELIEGESLCFLDRLACRFNPLHVTSPNVIANRRSVRAVLDPGPPRERTCRAPNGPAVRAATSSEASAARGLTGAPKPLAVAVDCSMAWADSWAV